MAGNLLTSPLGMSTPINGSSSGIFLDAGDSCLPTLSYCTHKHVLLPSLPRLVCERDALLVSASFWPRDDLLDRLLRINDRIADQYILLHDAQRYAPIFSPQFFQFQHNNLTTLRQLKQSLNDQISFKLNLVSDQIPKPAWDDVDALFSSGVISTASNGPVLSHFHPEAFKHCHIQRCPNCTCDHLSCAHMSTLLNGISYGFTIPLIREPDPVAFESYSSIFDYPRISETMINDFLLQGVITAKPSQFLSPMGLVVKDSHLQKCRAEGIAPSKGRLVLDLRVSGINDVTASSSLSYPSYSDIIRQLQPNGWFAKLDYKSFFHQFPIAEACQKYFAFSIRGYIDSTGKFHIGKKFDPITFCYKRFPMGWKNSPLFSAFVMAEVTAILRHRGINAVLIYVDDVMVFAATQDECQRAYDAIIAISAELGIPLSSTKCFPPAQSGELLGAEVDLQLGLLSVPQRARDKVIKLLQSGRYHKKLIKKSFEKIVGVCAWLVYFNDRLRFWLGELYASFKCFDGKFIHLKKRFWKAIAYFRPLLEGSASSKARLFQQFQYTVVSSDASGHLGCGGVAGRFLFRRSWSPKELQLHITAKEIRALNYLIRLFGASFQGAHILALSDNAGAASVINKGYSTDLENREELWTLYCLCEHFDIKLMANHLHRRFNFLADSLPR